MKLLRSLAVAALVLVAAGCGKKAESPSAGAGKPASLKVGLVFDIGGRGDKSFNDAAYAGLERAQQQLGIEFQTLETGEGSDREAQMRQLAADGSQLVFRSQAGGLFTINADGSNRRRLTTGNHRAPAWRP